MRGLGTAVAAGFLLWHGAAIAVAPYPDSELRRLVRPIFEPYLRAGYLDHRWTFFGPRPDAGRLVRYEIRLRDGSLQEFALSEAIRRSSPSWFRWLRLFDRAATGPAELQRSAAAFLCRRHAELHPATVRFIVLHQLTPSPELYRAGVRPTDAEALWREPGGEFECGAERSMKGEG